MMERTARTSAGEPRLLIPAFGALYPSLAELAWPMLRLVAGGTMLVHGIVKLSTGSFSVFVHGLATRGLEPAPLVGGIIYLNETIGAVCLILGLFTRFVAGSLAIELAVIAFVVSFPHGWGWTRPGGGWEYPFMWGVVVFAIALRGGGRYSLDRLLGWEI
jgi:putative oxidoreductase